MSDTKKSIVAQRIEEHIKKIEDKNFNVYFFILDTKGNPSGALEYIYGTALLLSEMGYNVTMLHQEKEFIGVADWLGEEYASLKHANIDTENVEIGPADFLIIPEIFADVIVQTKTLPCKRVILVQNFNNLCEFMPVGTVPQSFGINDVITTTKTQEKIIKEYFPNIWTHVVHPAIKPFFKKDDKPQKLIVNIVSRNLEDVNHIVKPFFWKYPIFKFVSFRDLRGVNQELFAEALREAAITIIYDDKSQFCYSALEAMRSGTITIVKLPEVPSDWCVVEKDGERKLTDACLWFENVNEVPDIIASVVNTWTMDKIPSNVYSNQESLNDAYTIEKQKKEIEEAYVKGLFERRASDMRNILNKLENNE